MTARDDRGLPPRVYLTGFMGSGKSTVAQPLAGLLGYEPLDLDAAVEAQAGMTVREIFARGGEQEFRDLERAALFATALRREIVVATGGGAILSEESFAFVRSAGALVYLRVGFETLLERLSASGDRPLLSPPPDGAVDGASGGEALRETVRRLMTAREPYYRRADIVIDPFPSDPGKTAAAIAAALRTLPRPPVT